MLWVLWMIVWLLCGSVATFNLINASQKSGIELKRTTGMLIKT